MAMTGDVYGHLLPDLENDAAKMEAGALSLVTQAPARPQWFGAHTRGTS